MQEDTTDNQSYHVFVFFRVYTWMAKILCVNQTPLFMEHKHNGLIALDTVYTYQRHNAQFTSARF